MLYSLQNPLPVFQKSYQNLHQCCCRIPMNGSGVVIEVYSADIGTHSLYSKIVSKLALVLLQNPTPLEYRSREINSRDTNERFQGSNLSIFCSLWNPSPVFENHIKCYRIPTPGSNQYSNHILQLPEQDFVSLPHPKSKFRTQKEEPNKLLLILFQRICFKQYSSRSRFASANRSASTSSQLFGVRYFQYSSLDLS